MNSSRDTCDEDCVCPIHGTALIYWPKGDEHACQDAACVHGHGGIVTPSHRDDAFSILYRGRRPLQVSNEETRAS